MWDRNREQTDPGTLLTIGHVQNAAELGCFFAFKRMFDMKILRRWRKLACFTRILTVMSLPDFPLH